MNDPYRNPATPSKPVDTCPHGLEIASLPGHERARLPVGCAVGCEGCGVEFARSQWIRKRVEEAWSAVASSGREVLPAAIDFWSAAEALYEEGRQRGHLR